MFNQNVNKLWLRKDAKPRAVVQLSVECVTPYEQVCPPITNRTRRSMVTQHQSPTAEQPALRDCGYKL
jgi:hypothetical protein